MDGHLIQVRLQSCGTGNGLQATPHGRTEHSMNYCLNAQRDGTKFNKKKLKTKVTDSNKLPSKTRDHSIVALKEMAEINLMAALISKGLNRSLHSFEVILKLLLTMTQAQLKKKKKKGGNGRPNDQARMGSLYDTTLRQEKQRGLTRSKYLVILHMQHAGTISNRNRRRIR